MNPDQALWEKGDFTRSPMTWGVESHVLVRFGRAEIPAERIAFAGRRTRSTSLARPRSSSRHFGILGPTMNAFDAAEKNGRVAHFLRELEALFKSQNRSTRPAVTSIPATFLRVTVTV